MISNSYFTGAFLFIGMAANNYLGGVAGTNISGFAVITNCYCAARSVACSQFYNFGGIVGYQLGSGSESGNYLRSDYSGNTVDYSNADYSTPSSYVKMTAAEMQKSSFVNTLNANTSGHSEWYQWTADSADGNGGYPVFVTLNSNINLSSLLVTVQFSQTWFVSPFRMVYRNFILPETCNPCLLF